MRRTHAKTQDGERLTSRRGPTRRAASPRRKSRDLVMPRAAQGRTSRAAQGRTSRDGYPPPRALVAQRIEHAPPKRGMQVRFLPGALAPAAVLGALAPAAVLPGHWCRWRPAGAPCAGGVLQAAPAACATRGPGRAALDRRHRSCTARHTERRRRVGSRLRLPPGDRRSPAPRTPRGPRRPAPRGPGSSSRLW